MKKNYLLIVDLLLINNKISLPQGLTSFVTKCSDITINGREDRWIKELKKSVFYKTAFFSILFFLLSFYSFAQVPIVPFTPRFNQTLQGDMLLVGNNILSVNKTTDYNSTTQQNNDQSNMVNVDIDTDGTTFNSSSADLAVPSASGCYKIKYAGLYWGAVVKGTDSNTKVKFKVPGGSYVDITGTSIYYQNSGDNKKSDTYATYADVTSYVTALVNPQGTYTVANVATLTGKFPNVEGLSAGWSLFIVYEDPTLPSKYITSFDGYSIISSTNNQDVTVSGFTTIPVGPVRAKFAFSALEGDKAFTGDFLQINGTTISATNNASTIIRPANDFFNSSVSYIDPVTNTPELFTTRNPKSSNTLGFDAGILNVPNASNSVIKNGDTSATIHLGSSKDIYYYYFNAFAVEVIEPKIVLTKLVINSAGVDIGNTNVQPKDLLTYVISFQNKGNDAATSFTIKDQLPANTDFVYPTDLGVLPAGVTVKSYDSVTKTLIFDINKSLVEIGDGITTIRIKVKVSDCDKLSDACSNRIDNQAYATYKGTIDPLFVKTDDPSLNANTGCLLVPKATNFLVGVENCKFNKSEVLCGSSVVLKAANGYNSYSWSTSSTGTPVIGTNQTLTVTNVGTYYVHDTAIAPCISIDEVVTVTRFGGVISNPVIPFADQVLTCPNDGKLLPNIYLCGAGSTRLINTNISDGSTIVWEKLNEASCTAVTNTSCANESNTCTWSTQVGTGAAYTANTSGQFRVTFNYPGGCFNRFYFNVYQNLLNPTETHRDIVCSTAGNITINGVGSGYEYSIDGTTYQASNSFSVNTAALYTAYIRQVGVATNPCVFTIPNISIRRRDFKVTAVATQPLCFGDKGSIKVAANDVLPQYNYFIYDSGTLVNSVGPIVAADYTFANLTPGKTYQVRVTTPDGCDQSQYIYINQPASALTATAALVEPLTSCSDGRILITAQGGVGPYYYFINGSATFQTSNEIIVTAPGPYAIRVVDSNNCVVNTSITVASNTKPTYTVSAPASINCYNDNATIAVNLTNANGYSMSYSIDNGGTFKNGTATGATFPNLTPGTYNVVVRYGITYTPQYGSPTTKYCTDPAQTVVITGPTSAVTASGGVAELAGCTLPNGAGVYQGGKLRINNPQGGTPAYEYSFDGGATWQSSNEKDVLPGTYILAIRDALGCRYTIPYSIILDPKPVEPTIAVTDPVFNCNGTATSTVTVTNSASNYNYEYLIDNTPNTPVTNNVFTNVVSGPHTISVKYNLNNVSTYSNLLQEDFGRGGYTTTPGISPLYCYEDETTPHPVSWPPLCGSINDYQINDGKYAVASAINTNFGGSWIFAKDHTLPADPLGRFLCVNVGGSAGVGGIIYSKPINDVIPNQPVIISLWAENLITASNGGLADPQLTIQLINNLNGVGGPETIVATTDTTNPWIVPKSERWEYNELSLNPGTYNNLSFVIRSYSIQFNGNDVLLDDIWVRQIPKSCITQKDFPIVIDSNRAFTASITGSKNVSCAGANDGEITIAAQNFAPGGFYYSLDGAPFVLRTTSPYTITGLSAGSHSVRVQYDLSASPCLFTLPQTITAPAAVTVTASITTPATCSTGATITAVGAGGTPAYQYELRNSSGVVRVYQSNAQFTNVPTGNYTVFARDTNLCISTVGAPVNVVAPVALTATLSASSDLCFDTVNQASLVVSVTGGTSPFTYSLNSAAAQNSNTFTNVGVGTHNILVTDSNNCTATISNISIAPQLQLTATLAQDLTCLVDASITSTIAGGYGAPYTYTGTRNGTALSPTPSFPFTATLAGTYVFTVTDSRGCQATSNAIVVSPKTTPTLTFTKTDITCNNANNGTITVTASNGFTSAYIYSYKLSSASSYTSTPNPITGLAAGTYNIRVTDSKGCVSAVSNVTIANPALVSGTISATDIQCSATGTVPSVVTVTGSGGTAPYRYSFNGTSSFTATNTFSTTTSGAVTAYVQDANNCQFGPLSVTIGALEPITSINLTDNGYDCSTLPAGGQVTISAVKTGIANTTNYQIISGPTGFNTAVNTTGIFQGLAAGNYVFQATDTKTNCSFTRPYTVSGTPAIVAGGSVVSSIKCFAGTGNIQFTVSGVGINGYDYVITNTGGVTVGSNTNQTAATITLNNQPASNYTITVTDRKTNCTATYTVILTQPTAAVTIATAGATNVNCNNDNAQITVTATGGTPNYTYAFAQSPSAVPTSTYSNSAVLTVDTNSSANLVWDVYVKDANDCTAKRTVTIVSDPTPSVTAVVSNQCTGSGSNFTITATGTGGTGTLTYGINGATGAFLSGNTFNVVASATPYTVWVKDANGCTASATPITVYPQLAATAAVTKTVDCSASPDAVITVTIAGGRSLYTYTVQKGAGAPSAPSTPSAALTFTYPVSNANADTYTFVITDANTCTSTTTATVNPIVNPTITATPTQVSCNGGTDGTVQLVGAGGSGGYLYSFNGSAFTATTNYTGLSAGIAYAYQVRDSKSCLSTPATIMLTQPTVLVATASATAFSCSATNTKQSAVVTIAVPTTGTAPYKYSFNGGGYTSTNTLTVNDNGTDQTINYAVKDNKGCIAVGTAVILNRLNPPTIASITGTPIYCAPVANTTSTVTVTRTAGTGVGTLAYTIESGPVINITGATTGQFTGLTAGTYIFKITDASGCFVTQSHTVPVVIPITAIATKLTDVDCFGNTTGSIRYNVSGFGTTYSYTVNGGTAVTGQTATVFNLSTLAATTYNVVFTDETTSCPAPTSIIITQPAAALSASIAQVNANCFVATSRITVTPAGGTASYMYAYKQDGVAPVLADYIVSNVADLNPTTNANWDIWVKDANGCTFKLDVVITTDPIPTVTASATGQCLGVGSYTITANGTGGTGTLMYSINAGASYQTGTTFVVTTFGNYTIRVKDANGCTTDSNVINVAPQLTLSAVLNKDITCNPAPTAAQITLTPTGGVGAFSYTASPSTGSFVGNVFTTNSAGNYTFTVTDATTGCTYTTTTPIAVTTPVNPDITGVTQTAFINCNGDDTAAITIAINNALGQSPFVFNVLNTTTGTNYGTQTSGLSAGNYTITVTDAKGCTDTQAIVIAEPSAIAVLHHAVPITCNGAGVSKGSVIVDSVSGGVGPYDYIVTGVNGYNASELNSTGTTSFTFDVVDFGLYQINVVDANGCSQLIQNVLVASPPDDLDINVLPAAPSCAGLGSAEISIGTSTSITGAGPFHFAVYTGPGMIYTGPTALPWYDEDAVGSKKTTIPNLIPGVTYIFVVHDNLTGCYYFETSTAPIPTNSTLTVNPLVANNITCRGAADGNVTFTMNHTYGVSTPVTYQIYNTQSVAAVGSAVSTSIPAGGTLTINNFGALPFGNYFVLITEAAGATNAGCSIASAPFDITESAIDLSVTATKIKTVNCNEDGIIAAQANDGTAPYTYQYLLASAPAPTALSAGWIVNTTFATSVTGNYIVYAKDAYGCIKQAPVTLDADDAPTVIAPAAPICYDGSTPFTITFSGTVDPDIIGGATYSVNGSAFQASPSFTFNAANTYNLVIKDGNNCTANVDYIVYPKLEVTPTLTKELDCTATPEATITLTTTGGDTTPAPNYTYEVSFNSGAFVVATNPYSAATAGNYVFRATDANNPTLCQATASFVLDPIVPTVFTPTATNVSCFGGTDGTITVNVTSGEPPYEYQLDAGLFQTSNVFTGLAAGTTYVITVRDAKQCLYPSAPITITQPVILTATSAITTALTCGAGNVAQPATVTVNGVNGTAPYQYSFDLGANYSTTNTYQSYVGITFDVYVKDAKGCLYTLPNGVDIPALVPPTDLVFSTTSAVTCLAAATVEITGHTGGVGTLQYETIAPSPIIVPQQTATTFAGLTAGTYLFQVTDANGCTYQESHTVAPVTNITVAGQLISDVTCNETPAVTNGAVTFSVGNFAGTYSYTINSVPTGLAQSAATINLTGLGIGNQVIVVTDDVTGCTATATVIVSQPVAPLSLSVVSNVNANCNIGAKVTVIASGGTPNYTYAFVANNVAPLVYTASASAVLPFTAPAPNDYDVWAKDNNGCTFKLDIQINEDVSPTIVMPAPQCYVGTPLTIDLSIGQTVAVGPATYTINGSNQVSPSYTINAPGTYQLSIVDGNGCSSNVVNYIVHPQLILTATMTQDLTCATNASITLTAAGGLAPYVTYEVNDGSGYVVSANPFTTATAGTYTFRVTDTQTCQAVSSAVTVTPNTTPTATFAQTNVSCIGGTDGTITLTPSGGIIPYQYSINGGLFQSSNVFSGLGFGPYTIVVRDAKMCLSTTIPVTITQPTAVTATHVVTPFGCNASNAPQDAIVTITAADGTPGYTYSFDNGASFQTLASTTVNTAQTINYVVRDLNGCSTTGSATVLPYTPPTDMDLTASPIYCSTPGTVATVTVNTVTGGVAPYTYEIISPAAAVTAPSAPSLPPFSFANLAPDTYTIKVTDANGCSTIRSIIVEEADKIAVTAALVNDVYCNAGATGAVNFMVSNYITAGSYTFSLTPAAGTMTQTGDMISYTNLPAGNYRFDVSDTVSGCAASVINFAIDEPALALSSTSVATNINCNNDTATVTITAVGGTAAYRYAIARASYPVPTIFGTSNQIVVDTNNGADMNWIVYVEDANNCTTTNTQTIILDANPTIATVIATQCPSATGTYDITVTASGFSAALEYSIDGASFQTSNVITVNAPGNYNVIVKDANGCLSAPTAVTILQPLTLAGLLTKVPTCNNADGEVTLTATGGTIPSTYQYSIDGLTYVTNNVFTGLAPNVTPYKFYVRDTNCVTSIDFTIEPAAVITGFAVSQTPVTCNGGNDGTITATMATPAVGVNDNPVYMYSLNGGTPQASNLFTGLIAGNYTVDVVSGRGCPATALITVIEPAIITVPAPTVVQFGCTSGNTMNFATITVAGVTGGSGTYLNYEFIKGGTRVQFSTSNVYTEADLLGGSYIVNVYDNKGCIGTTLAPIDPIDPYIALDQINVVVNNAITCTNLEDITVSVSSIGGTPANLQYTLVDTNATTGVNGALYPSQTNTTGIFTGLPKADYLITVANTDTGCSIQSLHYVSEPNTFEIKASNIADVVCFGANDGAATITFIDNVPTPTNEAGIFNYTVTGPVPSSGTSTSAVLNLTGLTKGVYTVSATLVGSPFCSVSTIFTIDGPNTVLNGTETHTEITCVPGSDGTISASATGGWQGGYEYQLVGPVNVAYSTNPEFTGLTAGSYTVNVRDSKGCVYPMPVILNNPTPIAINAIATAPILTCKGDNSGVITVNTTTGGQGSNYLYTINTTSATPIITSGPQTSPVFSGLAAGTYTIGVTDGWGCSATSASIVITEPTYVDASLVLASSQTCLTQSTLTLSATGGTGIYSYSDTANFAAVLGTFASSVTFPVPVGTYRYYVRDANGCVGFVSNDITIDPLPVLTVGLDLVNTVINCTGESTGAINAMANGGLGNYVYTLLDGSGNPIVAAIQARPGIFTGLIAGNYSVRVQSGDCTATSSLISITEPLNPLVANGVPTNVTCNGLGNGKITVTATGGTGIIKYAISPRLDQFFVSNVFENLTPGSYDIITQDQNGCYIYTTGILITEPNSITPTLDAASVIQELCFGDNDAAFSIDITGGTLPYSISLDNPRGPFTPGGATQTRFDFTGLKGGNHTVYIRDANLCSSSGLPVPMDASVKMNPQFVVTTECVNNAPANRVTVTIDPSVKPIDVDYALDGTPYATTNVFQLSNVFTNVAPGTHHITTRHSNGCEVNTLQSFTIAAVAQLTLTLTDGGLNEIVATATGGAGGYQYTFNGEDMGSQNKYIYYKSGTYIVRVTDANGCFAELPIIVKFIDIKVPNVFTPNGDGDNDGWRPENTINYPDLIFYVFDRYGRKVGSYREGEFWDGKYNGQELPTGDYWYVIKLRNEEDSREFVGHFTLYR